MTVPPSTRILVEACVETPAEAMAAQAAGAGRIELCSGLGEGGTTPSAGLRDVVLDRLTIPVFVIVRPRGGGFVYDDDELEAMDLDIRRARDAGVRGIVSGALTPDHRIDGDVVRRLTELARPLPFTFHRAFDLTPDLDESLDTLLELGVDRILTSGGAPTALEGADRLATLVSRAGSGLTIMAGGGVRAGHAADLIRRAGVREVHARPVLKTAGITTGRRRANSLQRLGERVALDPDGVRALVDAVHDQRQA